MVIFLMNRSSLLLLLLLRLYVSAREVCFPRSESFIGRFVEGFEFVGCTFKFDVELFGLN